MVVDEQQAQDRAQGGQASYRMKIGGMSCSFCTSTIRKAYERIDGVYDVGVSLTHEEGLVKYDPDKCSHVAGVTPFGVTTMVIVGGRINAREPRPSGSRCVSRRSSPWGQPYRCSSLARSPCPPAGC
jgi:copper chaperone CopZ